MHGDSNGTNAPGESTAMVDEGEPESGASAAEPATAEAAPAPGSDDPLARAQAEAARMKENWLRSAADFDNFRKRTRKELDDARRGGREDLLRALLPVFDNLER